MWPTWKTKKSSGNRQQRDANGNFNSKGKLLPGRLKKTSARERWLRAPALRVGRPLVDGWCVAVWEGPQAPHTQEQAPALPGLPHLQHPSHRRPPRRVDRSVGSRGAQELRGGAAGCRGGRHEQKRFSMYSTTREE